MQVFIIALYTCTHEDNTTRTRDEGEEMGGEGPRMAESKHPGGDFESTFSNLIGHL
jgi:hypothetical protein